MSHDVLEKSDKASWLERLSMLLIREPEDRDQLIELLHSAYERNLLDADALAMIEGAIAVSEMQVREVMVPRAQMDMIDINTEPTEFIPFIIETAHSRFPVFDKNRDEIIGILLAKDLLRFSQGDEHDIRDMLRPSIFIPESKPLNVLLRDFRKNRNHIAIVVDEYGGVAGLVTIEDVLEQIVGDIEDEYDFDETEDNLVLTRQGSYRIKASTELEDFNAHFHTHFDTSEYETIGGLILNHFNRLPKRGEQIEIEGLRFRILRADSRRIYSVQLENPPLSTLSKPG